MFIGSIINNIELIPGQGAKLVRAAGTSAYIYLKRKEFVFIKMPSGYLKKLSSSCIGSYSCVSFRL
jgi:large subunit ribosomal protein L2